MITVADILGLPAFKKIETAAPLPNSGNRPVWNIGILDRLPGDEAYNDFLPGEFIITNANFAKDDSLALEAAIIMLLERKVAALAINAKNLPAPSEAILKASEKTGVPLFLYDGEYIEVIAYQGLDLIRRDEAQADKRRLVAKLLSQHDPDKTRETLYQLAGVTGASIECFAVSPRKSDEIALYSLLGIVNDELAQFKQAHNSVEIVYACRYKDMLLAFASFAEARKGNIENTKTELVDRLSSIPNTYLGIGQQCALSDGDLTVREAITCLEVAKSEDTQIVRWVELRQDAYRAAAQESRLFSQVTNRHIEILRDHDENFGTQLEPTCLAVAQCYGDLRKVAENICTHVNTVRYRMKQAKKTLGMENYTDNEFVFFLGLVFLQKTNPFKTAETK